VGDVTHHVGVADRGQRPGLVGEVIEPPGALVVEDLDGDRGARLPIDPAEDAPRAAGAYPLQDLEAVVARGGTS
jgi:hypothetical protein